MAGPKKIASTVVHTGNRLESEIQARTRANTNAINRIPFLRGKLVTVKFKTGGTQVVVTHGLGVPAACFVARLNYDPGGAIVGPAFAEWVPQPTNIDPNNQLALACNQNNVTVDLWFYPIASLLIPNGKTQS